MLPVLRFHFTAEKRALFTLFISKLFPCPHEPHINESRLYSFQARALDDTEKNETQRKVTEFFHPGK